MIAIAWTNQDMYWSNLSAQLFHSDSSIFIMSTHTDTRSKTVTALNLLNISKVTDDLLHPINGYIFGRLHHTTIHH